MLDAETRRASYRCAVHDSRDAILTLDGREIPVELLDESADGLGLMLEGSLDCYVGQSAILQTASDWIGVRIMNMHVIPTEASDDADQTAGAVRTRLGLRRLKELPVDEQQGNPIKALLRGWRSLARRFMPTDNPLVTIGVPVTTVVLLILCLVWALERQRSAIEMVKREMPDVADAAIPPPSRGASRPTPAIAAADRPTHPTLTPTPPTTTTKTATREPTISEPIITHDILRWSHPALLVEEEIARHLALTPEQQNRLRELAHDPIDVNDRHEMGKAALAALTAEQRTQWLNLIADARARASRGQTANESQRGSDTPAADPFESDAEAQQLIKAEAERLAKPAP